MNKDNDKDMKIIRRSANKSKSASKPQYTQYELSGEEFYNDSENDYKNIIKRHISEIKKES